jgi:hypothetical protein
MFRALLTYPLILAVAVGPVLCCCTVGRVVASLPAPPVPSATPHSPVERTHSCCARKGNPPAKPAGDDAKPNRGKHDPGTPERPCPCKSGLVKVEATRTAITSPGANELLQLVTLDLGLPATRPGAAVLALGGGRPDIDPLGPSGSPSVGELLFAHHKLRC